MPHITYAGFVYLDQTLPLIEGEVTEPRLELSYVPIAEIGSLFRRMAQFGEFDAAEMSLSTLFIMRGKELDDLIAIPVFPSRTFRHGFIFVRRDSEVSTIGELRGKKIGIGHYQATAYMWIRAFMEHEHGVSPREVEWVEGGLDVTTTLERFAHDPPEGVRIARTPANTTLEEMLMRGQIDAIAFPERLERFSAPDPSVRRLVANMRSSDIELFQTYGGVPIMHTVVLRRDVYKDHSWMPLALLNLFQRAKNLSAERLRSHVTPGIALPGFFDQLREVDSVFKGDAFPYGFEANLQMLRLMSQLAYEQGLTEFPVAPESLFAPETLGWDPTQVC